MNAVIKITKKVVFEGLGGYTIYPGTKIAVSKGRKNGIVWGVPIDNKVAFRIDSEYWATLCKGLPFKKGEFVVL